MSERADVRGCFAIDAELLSPEPRQWGLDLAASFQGVHDFSIIGLPHPPEGRAS